MKLRGDDTFVNMCRSLLVYFVAMFIIVCGLIYGWHVIVR